MGDGKLVESGGLRLCTNSYSLKEVILLMSVLIYRYDLNCTIHKADTNQFMIFIPKNSMEKVRNLVKPYMVSSMFYKIHLTVPTNASENITQNISNLNNHPLRARSAATPLD